MLLRRVIDHVKEQNWTAIGIDFVIVVVGVFIGIQVANWNARLSDVQRAENYVERLTEEMEKNRQALSGRRDSYAKQVEYGVRALNETSVPTDEEAAWQVIHAHFQASHAFVITLQRGTYDEIISSGDLALLNDQKLVNGLSDFYTFAGFSTINVIPAYREHIRRIIPFEMQVYLQTNCYEVTEQDTHVLLDCPPPEGVANLVELATDIQADAELKRDLRYMVSFASVSSDIALNRMSKVDDVLTILSDWKG